MYYFKGYLTVADLDGTLINSDHNISKQNVEAITAYVREGGLFAVATGRTEINVKPYIKDLSINCPCILYNGAAIYDFNKNTYIKCISLDNRYLLKPLKEILSEYRNLCMQIFTPGNMFIVSNSNIDPLVKKEHQPFKKVCIDDIKEKNWIKIMLYDTNSSLKQIQHLLNDKVPLGVINDFFSASTYLEILAYGVSKGSALQDLIKIMNVELKKTIAIGDYCNDIEMIQIAGLGVATKNAHPSLKEAADITTVSNDEHVANYLFKEIVPNL